MYSEKNDKNNRKKSGQFFTPASVANFMGSMVSSDKEELDILDAGSGTGMLTAAVLQKIINLKNLHKVNIDLYENDLQVHDILKENLNYLKGSLEQKGICLNFKINADNFITSNALKWTGFEESDNYDIVISNPPYKKIGKNDDEANAMPEIVYGQPNLYFLFMAMGARLLKQGGEAIYIVPRSFTSGLYFSAFRKWFTDEMKITDLHIFTLRDEVFNSDDILQETIILRAVKTNKNIDKINITESVNCELQPKQKFFVDYNTLLDKNNNRFLYLPSTQEDIEVLNFVNQWKYTLSDSEFKIKTGLVVDFRETEWLREHDEDNTVPLLWAHNLKNNRVIFPANHKNKPQYLIDCPNTVRLQMRLDNYVILKRFTSKEETKRLQCSVLMKKDFGDYPAISTENHLNFITKISGGMSENEMLGIFVILNSSYMDKYFRILNGSTQVNANEINSLPFPSHNDIIEIGRTAIQREIFKENFPHTINLNEAVCDYILEMKYKPADIVAV